MDKGKVNIHGKEYLTVAFRINQFRHAHPDWSIQTEVIRVDDEAVIVKASISNSEGRVISTGLAEEYRDSSKINKTSALENAETSAVGRALAFYVFAGSEIASADEVANAIANQNKVVRYNKQMVQRYLMSYLPLIDAEDGIGLRQLEDELRENVNEYEIVWRLFDSNQKKAIKALVYNA